MRHQTRRNSGVQWWLSAAGLLALAILCAACGDDDHRRSATPTPTASPTPPSADAYQLGELDGVLAAELDAVLKPAPWQGQSDAPVIMAGVKVDTLTLVQQESLRAVYAAGQVIALTDARRQHIEALSRLLGVTEPVEPSSTMPPYDRFDVFAYREGPYGTRVLTLIPPDLSANAMAGGPPPEEPPAHRQRRAEAVPDWIERSAEPYPARAQSSAASALGGVAGVGGEVLEIYGAINSYNLETQWSVSYVWATCEIDTQSCINDYQLFLNAWPVYSQSNAEAGENPTDFFIVQLSANLSTAPCYGFYPAGGYDWSGRIAAYWARQYNLGAASQDSFDFTDLSIDPDYNPKTANPSTTVTTGTTWSFQGSGTVGYKAGSVGFQAGVSFTDSSTASYSALCSEVDVSDNNAVKWSYDSWNYVHSTIEPNDRACPSSLNPLPGLITNATFSPIQTFVWNASDAVRTQYGGTSFPIDVDFSVLLGWTYYFGSEACVPNDPTGTYPLSGSDLDQYLVGGGMTQGVAFDVGCNVETEYGTIPLGPAEDEDDSTIGNPGTPLPAPVWKVNLPFAPLSAPTPTPTPTFGVDPPTPTPTPGALAWSVDGASVASLNVGVSGNNFGPDRLSLTDRDGRFCTAPSLVPLLWVAFPGDQQVALGTYGAESASQVSIESIPAAPAIGTYDLVIQTYDCGSGEALPRIVMRGAITYGTVIYVSPSGSDTNAGTRTAPKQTLQEGINAAVGQLAAIIVDGGTYDESLTLMNGVVSIEGGFSRNADGPNSWVKSGAQTVVNGGTTAVSGVSIASPLTLKDLHIVAADSEAGGSSYGLYLSDSNLTVESCAIGVGRGGDGAAGFAGVAGEGGNNGANGGAGCEGGGVFCSNCAQPCGSGNTAAQDCSGSVGGTSGTGGMGGCGGINCSELSTQGFAGVASSTGASGGSVGPSGVGCDTDGGPAGAGEAGATGWNGEGGASFGSVDLVYAPADGVAGGDGGNGGGGGGGTGGGADTTDCDSFGGGGGDGGSGGCGGTGSGGGQGGGGSFGIWIHGGQVALNGNTITTNSGGAGGAVNPPGSGGQGGSGGSGGAGFDNSGSGGSGGDGGAGGDGGWGGGGGGGPSIGIVCAGDSQVTCGPNFVTHDLGGAGGISDGKPGSTGLSANSDGCPDACDTSMMAPTRTPVPSRTPTQTMIPSPTATTVPTNSATGAPTASATGTATPIAPTDTPIPTTDTPMVPTLTAVPATPTVPVGGFTWRLNGTPRAAISGLATGSSTDYPAPPGPPALQLLDALGRFCFSDGGEQTELRVGGPQGPLVGFFGDGQGSTAGALYIASLPAMPAATYDLYVLTPSVPGQCVPPLMPYVMPSALSYGS